MDAKERRAGEDRRQGNILNASLPFLTKDGLVFHERRKRPDRRARMGGEESAGAVGVMALNPA